MKHTDLKVRNRPSAGWLGGLAAAGLLLGSNLLFAGCGPSDGPLEVTQRVTKRSSRPVRKASSMDRFLSPAARRQSSGDGMGGAAEDRGRLPFAWTVPKGWTEVPPRSNLRVVDFRVSDDLSAECYMVAMSGDGGGLLANVNRWRGQVGLEPIMNLAALDDLPRHPLLGRDAPFIEISGDYTNMNAPVVRDAKLLGLVHSLAEITLFAKLTGPAEVVDAQREAFLDFCASLRLSEGGSQAAKPTSMAPQSQNSGTWNVPPGWSMTAPKPMRQVNYQLEGGGECYVAVLGGSGGGTLANVNRWLGQIGKPPLDAVGLAALPKIQMLGREAQLVEGSGDFEGMGAASQANQGLLGAMVELPDRAVFVKMIGPATVVQSQRSAFLAFAESLSEEDL